MQCVAADCKFEDDYLDINFRPTLCVLLAISCTFLCVLQKISFPLLSKLVSCSKNRLIILDWQLIKKTIEHESAVMEHEIHHVIARKPRKIPQLRERDKHVANTITKDLHQNFSCFK